MMTVIMWIVMRMMARCNFLKYFCHAIYTLFFQIVGNLVPVPLDVFTMEIPQQYRVTFRGDQDNGDRPGERMLLFSTQRNMRTLVSADHWFADGTLKVAPSLFYQLYTVHAFVGDRVLLCVYDLIPDKTQDICCYSGL